MAIRIYTRQFLFDQAQLNFVLTFKSKGSSDPMIEKWHGIILRDVEIRWILPKFRTRSMERNTRYPAQKNRFLNQIAQLNPIA